MRLQGDACSQKRNTVQQFNGAGRASFCFHETQEQGVANVEGQHADLAI